jgi:enterochelin esterase-like enzyme
VLAVEKLPPTSPTVPAVHTGMAPVAPADYAAPRDPLPGERVTGQTITGHVRLHTKFQSRFLDQTRDLWIYLPPGYEASDERYPVLYMHDGNNLFDAEVAFGGREWQADEPPSA